MKRFPEFVAAAALIVGAGGTAAGQAPPPIVTPVTPPRIVVRVPPPPVLPTLPTLPQGTPIAIPFAPPLGAPLEYSYSRSDVKAGERKRAAFDFTLLFERSGAGYLMTVTITVRGLSPEQRADPSIRMLERPITYRLAADGQIVAMDREDAYWRDVLQIARSMEKGAEANPANRGAMEKIIRHMRALPDAERLALAAANVAPVLEMAGTHMAVGERAEVKGERAQLSIPTPAQAKMRRDVSVTLDRADSESAGFTLAARYDEEATRAVMADLASLAPPGKRPDPAALPVQIADRTTHRVSRSSGLSSFYLRRLEGKDGAGGSYARTIIITARNLPR